MADSILRHGWHDTFGWLRRKEKDRPFSFCYEKPDGHLVYTGDPMHRDRAYIALMLDKDKQIVFTDFCYVPEEYRNGHV